MSASEEREQVEIRESYDLAEPPEKVWRALTEPALRGQWLPEADLAGFEPWSVSPGRSVSYRMRDPEPPFLESTVSFEIAAIEGGGTRLRILHRLSDARAEPWPRAANGNGPLMRAA